MENELDLPVSTPAPYPLDLESLGPDVTIIEPRSNHASEPLSASPAPSPAHLLDEKQRRLLELHFSYLTEIWNANVWTVYRRYKKHLPRERRAEVDRLCNFVLGGKGAWAAT